MLPIDDQDHPRAVFPIVSIALIAINVIVFIIQLAQPDPEAFVMRWGTVPANITAGEGLITLVTAIFLHGGWLHLLGNMLFLWIFGDNVEDAFGHLRYLLFYFASGIAAGLGHVLLAPDSTIPAVGASGAISGILGAYLIMFGTNWLRVLLGFIIVTVPAWLMIVLWIVFQLINGLASFTETAETGGVAYAAHVGGFVAGLVLTLLLRGMGTRDRPHVA